MASVKVCCCKYSSEVKTLRVNVCVDVTLLSFATIDILTFSSVDGAVPVNNAVLSPLSVKLNHDGNGSIEIVIGSLL